MLARFARDATPGAPGAAEWNRPSLRRSLPSWRTLLSYAMSLPPAPPTSVPTSRRPLAPVVAGVAVALAIAGGFTPTSRAADPEPKPMPAPAKPAPAVATIPAKPAIDLAVPKVVRTATFALG